MTQENQLNNLKLELFRIIMDSTPSEALSRNAELAVTNAVLLTNKAYQDMFMGAAEAEAFLKANADSKAGDNNDVVEFTTYEGSTITIGIKKDNGFVGGPGTTVVSYGGNTTNAEVTTTATKGESGRYVIGCDPVSNVGVFKFEPTPEAPDTLSGQGKVTEGDLVTQSYMDELLTNQKEREELLAGIMATDGQSCVYEPYTKIPPIPKPKTAVEWFAQEILNGEPWAASAIYFTLDPETSTGDPTNTFESLHKALIWSFNWCDAEEKQKADKGYWNQINDSILQR